MRYMNLRLNVNGRNSIQKIKNLKALKSSLLDKAFEGEL